MYSALRYMILTILLLNSMSCKVILRNLVGLKNPVSITKAEIIELNEELRTKDRFVIDYFFNLDYKSIDTSLINEILLQSINNSVTHYNNRREKICFNTKSNCLGNQLLEIKDSFDSKIIECEKINSNTVINYNNLDSLLKFISPIDTSITIDKVNFTSKKYIYFVTYYWSKYAGNRKMKKRNFEDFKSSVLQGNETNRHIYIVRINTDILASKRDTRRIVKIKLKKIKGIKLGYDIQFIHN